MSEKVFTIGEQEVKAIENAKHALAVSEDAIFDLVGAFSLIHDAIDDVNETEISMETRRGIGVVFRAIMDEYYKAADVACTARIGLRHVAPTEQTTAPDQVAA